MASMDQGPPVNLLSAAQLRLLARIRGLRPDAEIRWSGDELGWSVEVIDSDRGGRPIYTARLHRTGSITAARSTL